MADSDGVFQSITHGALLAFIGCDGSGATSGALVGTIRAPLAAMV
jgi:hypothetical protein